jgi:hypothetical protein
MGPRRANETSVHSIHSHFRPKQDDNPASCPHIRHRTTVNYCAYLKPSERVSIAPSPEAQPLTSSSTPWQSLHTAHDQSCRAVQRSERLELILKPHT